MKIVKHPPKSDWDQLLERPSLDTQALTTTVREVFKQVKLSGDAALTSYTQQFDKVYLEDFKVSETDMKQAQTLLSPELSTAIDLAKANIEKFHAAQRTEPVRVETMEGVACWQEKRPIQKVGVYIPGGSAPLFSTVLMLVVPAVLAGCSEIVICSPPNAEGKIHPAILYSARICGVTTVYRIGGIQAIAAMTYGTATVPKVYKILGPGNQFVTAAKQWAIGCGVAIDMPAGPSEVMVVVDNTAIPAFVASDLLSQAEHGADSQVVLIAQSEDILKEVLEEVGLQLANLPRKSTAEQALKHARIIYLPAKEDALEMINSYAPEHLIICSKDESYFTDGLQNAGSVFLGNYTPESAGDYASGTNHTLPTNGYAKQYSGVNLDSFTKSITFQKIDENGIQQLGPAIEVMAAAEGLQGHKNAVTLRLKTLK